MVRGDREVNEIKVVNALNSNENYLQLATDEEIRSLIESKKIKDLYFAGEVIDVDAYTGGFNLQIAFSTGFLAGMNA